MSRMSLNRAVHILRRRLRFIEDRIRRHTPLRTEASQLHDRMERAALDVVLEELCAPPARPDGSETSS